MCVNAYACVRKVPSNICRVKVATVAKPTGVSHLDYLIYTSMVRIIPSWWNILFANLDKTTKLVHTTNSVYVICSISGRHGSSCFTRQAVSMTNSEGFFASTEEVRLRRETLDDQRIVCSVVFTLFHKLTIFSAKLSFRPRFVVVCE